MYSWCTTWTFHPTERLKNFGLIRCKKHAPRSIWTHTWQATIPFMKLAVEKLVASNHSVTIDFVRASHVGVFVWCGTERASIMRTRIGVVTCAPGWAARAGIHDPGLSVTSVEGRVLARLNQKCVYRVRTRLKWMLKSLRVMMWLRRLKEGAQGKLLCNPDGWGFRASIFSVIWDAKCLVRSCFTWTKRIGTTT